MEKRGESLINIRGDRAIWIIVILLSLISIVAVYSSSSALAFREQRGTSYFLLRQMRFVVFGLTALYICYKIPLGWYRMLSYFGMALSIILLLLTLKFGKSINDAERWLRIMGISFQPAELAKVTTILYIARVLESKPLKEFREYLLWLFLPVGSVILLILYGSFSTALLLGGISALLFILGGVKWAHLLKSLPIVLGLLLLVFTLNTLFGLFPRVDTAINRVKNFGSRSSIDAELTPLERQRALDKTFQADMAEIAVASAGLLGKGPGKSSQRNLLPHPYSDFIYAIIIEEWGLIGAIALLLLYISLFSRSIMLVRSCTTTFTAILVSGLALLITSQAMLHICVNVGIIPVTGHTLPLVSLGGTSLVIISGAFGVILSVSRTVEITSEREIKKREILEKEVENG